MEPVYDRFGVTVFHGDNLDVLREIPDASVDSIVTDPPAGIGFMRDWDSDRGGREQWVAWLRERMIEACRVLKPGGHALVWAMPRTSHWTGWALEDAGLELRDCVQHEFGQGMPKSLDVAKALDRQRYTYEQIRDVTAWMRARCIELGVGARELDAACGTNGMGSHWTTQGAQAAIPTAEQWRLLEPIVAPAPDWLVALIAPARSFGASWSEREIIGRSMHGAGNGSVVGMGSRRVLATQFDLTAPASAEAKRWQGWGTALAPRVEPWWLCRKPTDGRSVAHCITEFGTGAINIDASRGADGSWPANIARFPKAPPSERPLVNGEQHVTVKSVALCRWLVRLVTPPDGVVLDLFAGTGPVGQAARAEGKRAILIEQDEESIGFIKARLDARPKTEAGAAPTGDEPMDLLDLLGGDAS